MFNSELFGQVSEEKEVEGIVASLFEAKTTKSIDSYGILATVVSSATLVKLIMPLKTVCKIRTCFFLINFVKQLPITIYYNIYNDN